MVHNLIVVGHALTGEMPPKRGRGRGRGKPPDKPSENIPSEARNIQVDQRSGSRSGRGRGVSAFSSPRPDELHRQSSTEPSDLHKKDASESRKPISYATGKSSDDDTSSGSSTSSLKHENKRRNVAPEEIGLKFENKSSDALILPKRPGYGTKGRYIRVVSNCYPIKIPSGYVYHYDIEIIENNQRKSSDAGKENKKYRCLNSKTNRKVVSLMLESNPIFHGFYGAFDGRTNLLTRKQLNVNLPFSCEIMLPGEYSDNDGNVEYDNYKVEIKSLVSKINLESINAFYEKKSNDLPQEAIMAVETILRHGPCLKFTPIGRSFFYPPDVGSLTPFGGGLEIWFGYHQSLRLSQWKPTVNINTTATTFWKEGPLINIIAEFMKMSVRDLHAMKYMNKSDIRRINRKLKQLQVRVTHLKYPRKYRIFKLRENSASCEYIEIKDKDRNTRITVEEYFRNCYRKRLEFAHLPCLQVNPEKKKIYLPLEVCELVPGQHCKAELTAKQRSEMIKFTSKSPHIKFREIQDITKKANFNQDKAVQDFRLEVSRNPLTADARVLDPPHLIYKNEKQILPRDGSWDVRNTQFFQGAKISDWVLLSFSNRYRDNLNIFADLLVRIGRNFGLEIDRPSRIDVIRDPFCDKERLFSEIKSRGNQLAVVVIPSLDEHDEKRFYAEVKRAAETAIGLTTQCMKEERLRDMQGNRGPQIASNLCLKINAKLGGENHSLFDRDIPSIMCKPVIIIGADVNHPPPTQLNQPSIAACVGSLDCLGKRFAVSIRAQVNSSAQKIKVEEICELEDMVRDLLIAFYRHTKQKPEKIIFYRDGVSEGELVKTVKHKEIVSIRKACLKMPGDYKPGITVIVVQKRHHVRFRTENPRDGVGKMSNIPPGTVIDKEVTHPQNFDFFLCSQFGLQGTSRPSHYLVVEDDNDLSADELQKLTFYMCHMYVRCTKSISIPAPVAYADLVAYRARRHLDCKKGEDSGSSSDSSGSYRLTQEDINAIKVVENLKDSMYFV